VYCPSCKKHFDETTIFCPEDGQALASDPLGLVGNRFDDLYHIEDLIGVGGCGVVYKAQHIMLGRRVAIKALLPEKMRKVPNLRRFQREGQAGVRFTHPNIVTIHDLRMSNAGVLYLVMEYVKGYSLRVELLRRQRLAPAEAATLLDPIADALTAAHEHGVVHRDVKPENILLTGAQGDYSAVKLLDLGVAKLLSRKGDEDLAASPGETPLTAVGELLGTPPYMSPEQWNIPSEDGDPRIDGRADVYSLGVMLFELVAGRYPFFASSPAEWRRHHILTPPPLLHKAIPGVPEKFALAVARAMSKDRVGRQSGPAKLAEEIRQGLSVE
jgi:serine/threonine-protein kinase